MLRWITIFCFLLALLLGALAFGPGPFSRAVWLDAAFLLATLAFLMGFVTEVARRLNETVSGRTSETKHSHERPQSRHLRGLPARGRPSGSERREGSRAHP